MISEIILTVEMVWLTLSISGLMLIVGRVKIGGDAAKHRVNRMWWWQRFGTLIALALGVGGSFVPGAVPPETGLAHQLFFGIIAATFAVTGRNAFKDNIFKILEGRKK